MRRMRRSAPVLFCMDCESFTHPLIYQEPDDQLKRDAEWHVTVEDRNATWSGYFLDGVMERRSINSIIEIGCATGTLLSVARNRNVQVYGFDTNPYAKTIAWERHGIVIQNQLWNRNTIVKAVDVVACISVIEHLENPAALMNEIGAYCSRHGAAAFVTVPFVTERCDFDWLNVPVPKTIKNPFYLVDVHINHFSRKAFEKLARDAGATTIRRAHMGWVGYWLEF
ncbi:MAG: class I SAM-dependent methyltransferase [Pseudomonadota bacterium]